MPRCPSRSSRNRRLAAVAIVLVAAGVGSSILAGTASAQARVMKMIWGPVNLPNGQPAFPVYHRLGVNMFETELMWNQVASRRPQNPTDPNDPAYEWPSSLDEALSQASLYGIQVCLEVEFTPRWANGHRAAEWAPTNPADYANFLTAAARRYPTVHDWMIWGEPNRSDNFRPLSLDSPVGPRRYAILLNAAYHALKGVSTSNLVIGGDTTSDGVVEPADFVRWMRLPNGQPPPLDFYGHNPYGARFPNLSENPNYPGARDLNDIDTLHQQLVQTYHHQVRLWLAEDGVSSDSANYAFDFWVSRKGQAEWLTAAYNLVNSVNYVAGLGWFELLDEPPTVPRHLTLGLMTWNLKPKPAFYAYEHAR